MNAPKGEPEVTKQCVEASLGQNDLLYRHDDSRPISSMRQHEAIERRKERKPSKVYHSVTSSSDSPLKPGQTSRKVKTSSRKKKKGFDIHHSTAKPSSLNQPSSLPPDATPKSNEEASITSSEERQLVAWKRHRRKLSSQRQSDNLINQMSHFDSPKANETTTSHRPEQSRSQSRAQCSSSRHQTRRGGDDHMTFGKRHHHLRESRSNHPSTAEKKENRVISTVADSASTDSDETLVAKPGRDRSDSEGPRRGHESDSSLSSLGILQGFTPASCRGGDPPTDLEFAEEMDSAAKKLKKFAKDQEEAVVRKQVDYDQLQELLENPKEGDQERLNRLLITMGESAVEFEASGNQIFANAKDSSNLVSSDKNSSLADYLYDSLGNESSSSLTATEIESIFAAIQLAGGEADAGGFDTYIDETHQERGVQQEDLNSVRENGMKDNASMNGKLAAVDGPPITCPQSIGESQLSPQTVSQPTRMEIHKQEILQVFGGNVNNEEEVGTPNEESACVPSNMAMHKQDVLEVFGVQARPRTRMKAGKYVSIPLKPAVLTRATEEKETEREDNEMKVPKIVESLPQGSIGSEPSKTQSEERSKADEKGHSKGDTSKDAFSNFNEAKTKSKPIQLRIIAKRFRGTRKKTSQDSPE